MEASNYVQQHERGFWCEWLEDTLALGAVGSEERQTEKKTIFIEFENMVWCSKATDEEGVVRAGLFRRQHGTSRFPCKLCDHAAVEPRSVSHRSLAITRDAVTRHVRMVSHYHLPEDGAHACAQVP